MTHEYYCIEGDHTFTAEKHPANDVGDSVTIDCPECGQARTAEIRAPA